MRVDGGLALDLGIRRDYEMRIENRKVGSVVQYGSLVVLVLNAGGEDSYRIMRADNEYHALHLFRTSVLALEFLGK